MSNDCKQKKWALKKLVAQANKLSKTTVAIRFDPLQSCPSFPSIFCIFCVVYIFFYVLSGYFYSFAQFDGSSYFLNFDVLKLSWL